MTDDLFSWQRPSYRGGFPGHHAGDESETSYEAAKDIAPRAESLRQRVLASLREEGPASSTQLAKRLEEPFDSVQPRTSELKRAGLIEDSGERAPTQYGKPSIVWRMVPL